MSPIAKAINKKVSEKWLALLLKLVISFAIIFALYTIADLLGIGLSK
jgi:hypothetical protein